MNSGMAKKKKSRKYKVHYDRLIAQLLLLALIVFGCIWLVRACIADDDSEPRPVHRDAIEAGRADAQKVLHTHPGSMERDEALLFIRSREQSLRSNGHGHAADDYINAARQTLAEQGIGN